MKRHSRHAGKLQNTYSFDDYYPEVEITTKSHGSYTLEGRIITSSPDLAPDVMVIHGAKSDYSSNDKITVPLHQKGLNILSATISGHGVCGHQSEKPFTLDESLQEAIAFSKLMQNNNATLIGISMGGTTAVRLLQTDPQRFSKLILFYPTAFPDEAYSIPFGTNEFRKITGEKGTFLESSFFSVIKSFQGKIMLIKGEFDGLEPNKFSKPEQNAAGTITINGREIYSPIPPEVFNKITTLRPDTTFIEVPDADHRLSNWAADHPEGLTQLIDHIYAFINA